MHKEAANIFAIVRLINEKLYREFVPQKIYEEELEQYFMITSVKLSDIFDGKIAGIDEFHFSYIRKLTRYLES